MRNGYKQAFAENGYLAPVPLLTAAQCKLVADTFHTNTLERPKVWQKALAVHDRLVFDIATRPATIDLLKQLLGVDVIFWGASIQHRKPNEIHHWHCDMESMAPSGKFASIWIGLENVSKASALKLVPHSHRFGRSIQEVQHRMGLNWGETEDEDVLEWSKTFNPDAEIVQPDMSNGDAIVFDGRLWHGSENGLAEGARTALLLQYAHADEVVKMPAPKQRGWPFELVDDHRPPVLSICGEANEIANNIANIPMRRRNHIPFFTRSFPLPMERDEVSGWKRHPVFKGRTDGLQNLTCHVSVLEPGNSPHSIQTHIEEELKFILEGEADFVLANSLDDTSPQVIKLRAGEMIYHPAYQHHTIRNTGDQPVTYMMLKWISTPLETHDPLSVRIVKKEDHPTTKTPVQPVDARALFEQETVYLSKLNSHIVDLQPDANYDLRLHDCDIAVILLSGQITAANETLNAPAIAFFPENELHAIHNTSENVACYRIFEFHGEHKAVRNLIKERPPAKKDILSRLSAFASRLRSPLSPKRA